MPVFVNMFCKYVKFYILLQQVLFSFLLMKLMQTFNEINANVILLYLFIATHVPRPTFQPGTSISRASAMMR